MRKKVSLFLCILLIVMVIIPIDAMAEYDKELQNAILKAKSLFNITEEYDKFNYSLDSHSGKTQYYLNWSDSKNKLGNISVTIDNKGIVRNYNRYTPYFGENRPSLPKISKTDALNKAYEFIKKVNPDCINNIKYLGKDEPLNINSRYYYFDYIRIENGIPYYLNNINVSVNKMTGEVMNYYCNWEDDITFPDTENLISLEKAQEIFKEQIGLMLVCRLSYKDGEIEPYLVYTSLNKNKSVDAKTGEIVSNYSNYYYDSVAETKQLDGRGDSNLTPEEREAVENTASIISEERIEKIARDFLGINDDYELRSINLYSDWRIKGEYIWSLEFYKEDKEKSSGVSISLDGKTGEVRSFYKYLYNDINAQVKYDKDKALNIAQEYIEKIHPDKVDQIQYVDWDDRIVVPLEQKEQPRRYDFRFIRKSNDIYVENDGFYITVDTVTGDVVRYNYTWYKGELPSIDNIIQSNEAYNILFSEIGMELEYITKYPRHYYEEHELLKSEAIEKEVKLVYSIKKDKPLNIDAASGQLIYTNGEPYRETTISQYKDISGSYAENQIKILAEYGISLPGNEFRPKEEIKQRDFLYLIAKAKNYYLVKPYSDDSGFDDVLYERLIREGIVKENEKAPQSPVTREDAVKFIVRALNYDEVAEIEGIYKVPFNDADKINPKLEGYVAIAYGLKIIGGSDGYFYPYNNLTREQAAVMIYNFLNIN